ncbi:hypothetical protein BpHYR1_041503 [Brachionus plicatilis]|uniref:Uncharacterized protein n=1 Tax=Brachionus plicatilis TaxID=10195 RepID=A0A3M7RA64_BRAPC|nr:hypothetical protein BpHYR1_041503 [Brachionus plicatilis]
MESYLDCGAILTSWFMAGTKCTNCLRKAPVNCGFITNNLPNFIKVNQHFGGLPLFLGFSFSNGVSNFFDLPQSRFFVINPRKRQEKVKFQS